MNSVTDTRVALVRATAYPSRPPFAPGEAYPEFRGTVAPGSESNRVFEGVRELFLSLGLDAARAGTDAWNPLGDLVAPGAQILVKPNWVLHRNEGDGGMDCMVTHPSVLRAVLEYAFLARPRLVVLGDAPLQGCDWDALQGWGGLPEVLASFRERGLPLAVRDFRRTRLTVRPDGRKSVEENVRPASEYVEADLGRDSFLEPVSGHWRRFRVTMYDPRAMAAHHRPGIHRYLLAREAFESDLILNCPKLKTHKKSGLTCCLKNLIGINGNKEYLPHHRRGAADEGRGGDARPERSRLLDFLETALDFINRHRSSERFYRWAERWIYRFEAHRPGRVAGPELEGNWRGNDTIWRTCLDLNRALLHAGADAVLHETPQRRELSVVDAVVAGQGEGPLRPFPLATGAMFAALNPGVGDWLAARLLGYDPERLPLTAHAADAGRFPVCAAPLPEVDAAVAALLARDAARPGGAPFPPAERPAGWRE